MTESRSQIIADIAAAYPDNNQWIILPSDLRNIDDKIVNNSSFPSDFVAGTNVSIASAIVGSSTQLTISTTGSVITSIGSTTPTTFPAGDILESNGITLIGVTVSSIASSIAPYLGSAYVPYMGAIQNVNLNAFDLVNTTIIGSPILPVLDIYAKKYHVMGSEYVIDSNGIGVDLISDGVHHGYCPALYVGTPGTISADGVLAYTLTTGGINSCPNATFADGLGETVSICDSSIALQAQDSGSNIVYLCDGTYAINVFAGTVQIADLPASSSVYTDPSSNLTTTAPTTGTLGYWTRQASYPNLHPATPTDTVTAYNFIAADNQYATASGFFVLNKNSQRHWTFTGSTALTIQMPIPYAGGYNIQPGHTYVLQNNASAIITVEASTGAVLTTIPANAGFAGQTLEIIYTGSVLGDASAWCIRQSGQTGFIPYTGATTNVNIGSNSLTANSFIGPLTGNASSASALSISGQTGLLSVTGLTSTNRIKTVRDAADTLLELGGSYTPTGTWTQLFLQDANDNVRIGLTTGSVGSSNILIGRQTGQNLSVSGGGSNGTGNTFIGDQCGTGCTTGYNNVGLGIQALAGTCTGNNNVGIGYNSLGSITSGTQNFAMGPYAGSTISNQNANVLIGYVSGQNGNLGQCVGIGSYTLRGCTAVNCIAIGYVAGASVTSGGGNIFIGANCGQNGPVTGANNTLIGQGAGYNMGSSDANNLYLGQNTAQGTTGSNNTYIGTNVGAANSATNSNNVWIGYDCATAETSLSNTFIVDNQSRSAGGSATNAILYGVMASASLSQTLKINAAVTETHVIGGSALPTLVLGAGAGITGVGTVATATIAGSDMAGVFTLTTGTDVPVGSNAIIVTITFAGSYAYPNAPYVSLTPTNAATALLTGVTMVYPTSTTTTFVINSGSTALSISTVYAWNYMVVG